MNLYQKILDKAPMQNKLRGKDVILEEVEQIGYFIYATTSKGYQVSINLQNETFNCLCPAFWHQKNKKDYVDIPEVEKVPCKHICKLCEKMLEK
jgi:hypothetical protein